MIVFEIIGGALLLVGIIFIFPCASVSSLGGKTTGKVIGMTRDATVIKDTVIPKTREETKEKEEKEEKSTPHIHVRVEVGGSRMDGTKPVNMYHMIFYYCVDGKEYCQTSRVSYNKGYINKKIGKDIPVYYDTKNPERASLSSGKVYEWLSTGLIAGGIVFLIAGLVVKLIFG